MYAFEKSFVFYTFSVINNLLFISCILSNILLNFSNNNFMYLFLLEQFLFIYFFGGICVYLKILTGKNYIVTCSNFYTPTCYKLSLHIQTYTYVHLKI